MRKFTVKALSVGGKGNKIFNSGDIVSEDNFPAGNCDALVKGGFLTEIKQAEAVTDSSLEEPIETESEESDQSEETKTGRTGKKK